MTSEPAVNTTPGPGQNLLLDVDVTQGCIDMGVPDACTDCPLALALLRSLAACGIAVRQGAPVIVQRDHCTVSLADTRLYGGNFDSQVRAFIEQFDHRQFPRPQPFRFRLRLEQHLPCLPDRIERFVERLAFSAGSPLPPAEG